MKTIEPETGFKELSLLRNNSSSGESLGGAETIVEGSKLLDG